MPKLIDHELKKLDIAQATWKIMIKEGAGGASVRNIAKEAGITLGALRYYFTTQDELMGYTENLVHESITEKAADYFMKDLPPQKKIIELLLALLPDRSEADSAAVARLLFKLQPGRAVKTADTGSDSVYQAVKSVMSNLVMLNLLKKDRDLSLETERLYALMDGLAMDHMLRWTMDKPEKTRKILEIHINSICKEPSGDFH